MFEYLRRHHGDGIDDQDMDIGVATEFLHSHTEPIAGANTGTEKKNILRFHSNLLYNINKCSGNIDNISIKLITIFANRNINVNSIQFGKNSLQTDQLALAKNKLHPYQLAFSK